MAGGTLDEYGGQIRIAELPDPDTPGATRLDYSTLYILGPLNTRMQMTMPQHHNAAERLRTSKHTTAVYLQLFVCSSASNISTAQAAGL